MNRASTGCQVSQQHTFVVVGIAGAGHQYTYDVAEYVHVHSINAGPDALHDDSTGNHSSGHEYSLYQYGILTDTLLYHSTGRDISTAV